MNANDAKTRGKVESGKTEICIQQETKGALFG